MMHSSSIRKSSARCTAVLLLMLPLLLCTSCCEAFSTLPAQTSVIRHATRRATLPPLTLSPVSSSSSSSSSSHQQSSLATSASLSLHGASRGGRHRETTHLSAGLALDPAVAAASLQATIKLLFSIGLGGMAAKNGVLNANAVSVLSKLTYSVFQPAFLMASVGKTLASAATSTSASGALPARLLALMPLAAAVQIGVGRLIGMGVTTVVPLEREAARNVRVCTAFANSGPLPLLLADALFAGSAVQSQVAACVSFYLLLWSPLFWTVGRTILGTAPPTSDWKGVVKSWLSPPVIGSLAGVVVGGVPILRKALFGGGWATPLMQSVATLGTAYIPAALLVLAGSLLGTSSSSAPAKSTTTSATDASNDDDDKKMASSGLLPQLLTIGVCRFLVAPLLSLALVQAVGPWLGPAGSKSRAVVSFCLLMEGCMPPAQNTVIILQLSDETERAQVLAKLLTTLYAIAVVPVTLLISLCLSSSGILKFA